MVVGHCIQGGDAADGHCIHDQLLFFKAKRKFNKNLGKITYLLSRALVLPARNRWALALLSNSGHCIVETSCGWALYPL